MSERILQTEAGPVGYSFKMLDFTHPDVRPILVNETTLFGKITDKLKIVMPDGRSLSPEKQKHIPEITQTLKEQIPFMDTLRCEVPKGEDSIKVDQSYLRGWQKRMMEFVGQLPHDNQVDILSGHGVVKTLVGREAIHGGEYVNIPVGEKIFELIASKETSDTQKLQLLSCMNVAESMTACGKGEACASILTEISKNPSLHKELASAVGQVVKFDGYFVRKNASKMLDVIKQLKPDLQREVLMNGFFDFEPCATDAANVISTFPQTDQLKMLNDLYLGGDNLIDGGGGKALLKMVKQWPLAEQERYVQWQASRFEHAGALEDVQKFIKEMPEESRERMAKAEEHVRSPKVLAEILQGCKSKGGGASCSSSSTSSSNANSNASASNEPVNKPSAKHTEIGRYDPK